MKSENRHGALSVPLKFGDRPKVLRYQIIGSAVDKSLAIDEIWSINGYSREM